MVEMTGALLNSTKSQSPETQKDPEVQKEVVKTMSSFAGAAKHLTKESKVFIFFRNFVINSISFERFMFYINLLYLEISLAVYREYLMSVS
jgi:hypothetical protein